MNKINFSSLLFTSLTMTAFACNASTDSYAVYAAFVSDEVKETCQSFDNCQINTLTQSQYENVISDQLSSADSDSALRLKTLLLGNEYELLAGSAQFNIDKTVVNQIEYTLNWRGIPIFEITAIENDIDLETAVLKSSETLLSEIEAQDALNPFHLFNQVDASDYYTDLNLPDHAAGFTRQQMQLQEDPTRGTIVRYQHDQFPTAVIDVYVYPMMKHNYQQIQAQLMQQELLKDKAVIKSVVQQRNIAELNVSDIQTNATGFKFEAAADDGIDEMFTSQYIFTKSDKFVKFSANMPAQFADAMVTAVMQEIVVPAPSDIMNAFRDVDRAFSEVNEAIAESSEGDESEKITIANTGIAPAP